MRIKILLLFFFLVRKSTIFQRRVMSYRSATLLQGCSQPHVLMTRIQGHGVVKISIVLVGAKLGQRGHAYLVSPWPLSYKCYKASKTVNSDNLYHLGPYLWRYYFLEKRKTTCFFIYLKVDGSGRRSTSNMLILLYTSALTLNLTTNPTQYLSKLTINKPLTKLNPNEIHLSKQ